MSYTQSDVDTIREQIEQNESAKRRWLVLALIIVIAALVGAVALLTTSYALYAKSESEKEQFSTENDSLKIERDQYQAQLDTLTAEKQRQEQARADAQAKIDRLRAGTNILTASDGEIATFARIVSELPQSKIELDVKPPDKIFRNWKVRSDEATDVYTLVGGFVDGKWVIHSNLVARVKSGA